MTSQPLFGAKIDVALDLPPSALTEARVIAGVRDLLPADSEATFAVGVIELRGPAGGYPVVRLIATREPLLRFLAAWHDLPETDEWLLEQLEPVIELTDRTDAEVRS